MEHFRLLHALSITVDEKVATGQVMQSTVAMPFYHEKLLSLCKKTGSSHLCPMHRQILKKLGYLLTSNLTSTDENVYPNRLSIL